MHFSVPGRSFAGLWLEMCAAQQKNEAPAVGRGLRLTDNLRTCTYSEITRATPRSRGSTMTMSFSATI